MFIKVCGNYLNLDNVIGIVEVDKDDSYGITLSTVSGKFINLEYEDKDRRDRVLEGIDRVTLQLSDIMEENHRLTIENEKLLKINEELERLKVNNTKGDNLCL